MPLTPIPNQPINIDPYVDDDCLTADDKAYCALFNTGDTLYLQAINTSCDGELFCNPTFEAAQGTAITVTNPNFVGSLTGWSVGPGTAAWTWDASAGAKLTYSTSSSVDKSIWQTLTGMITGMSYTVSFIIRSNTTTTGLCVDLHLGNTVIGSYSANGSYSVNVVCGAGSDILFIQSGGSDGTLILDSITVEGLTDCFSAIGTDWEIAVGGAIKLSGTASDLVFPVTTSTTGVPYFKVAIHVTNQTAGTLTVTLDGYPIATITANGEYTGYNICAIGGGDLTLAADTLFDGTVTYLSVEELPRNYLVNVIDMTTGVQVADLVADGDVSYVNDRLIVASDTTDIGEGCFQIQIIDPCTATQTEIFQNPEFTTALGTWTAKTDCPDFDCYDSLADNKLTQTIGEKDPTNTYALQPFSSGLILTGDCYLTFRLDSTLNNDSQDVAFVIGDGASVYTNLHVFSDVSTPTISITLFFAAGSIDPTSVDMGIWIQGSYDSGGTGTNIITYAQITKVATSGGGVLTSNCFSIAAEHDCAKLIEGYGDTGTTTHGFLWQGFKLSHRIQFLSFNPSYPIEGDNYMFSDTSRKQTYATRERYVVGKVNYIDQTAHDTVSAQIICKTFNVAGVQYFVSQEGYKPEWNNEGQQKLAQSKIEMRKILGTLYSK